MAISVDAYAVQLRAGKAGERVELGNFLNLVAKKADTPCGILIMRREDFEIVATHAEITARKAHIIALILKRDQLADQLPLIHAFALFQVENHSRVCFDGTDTVNARNGGHNDDIITFQQRPGRRMAHPINRFVYARFFFDIGVAARDIGFGLIIVVIRYEIFDGIVGEKAFEFAVKLRR